MPLRTIEKQIPPKLRVFEFRVADFIKLQWVLGIAERGTIGEKEGGGGGVKGDTV